MIITFGSNDEAHTNNAPISASQPQSDLYGGVQIWHTGINSVGA